MEAEGSLKKSAMRQDNSRKSCSGSFVANKSFKMNRELLNDEGKSPLKSYSNPSFFARERANAADTSDAAKNLSYKDTEQIIDEMEQEDEPMGEDIQHPADGE